MDVAQTPSDLDDLVRAPKQERSRETLNRIVEAALVLIDERGVDGASVHDITRRAGASVGSFYARFRGKEELLRYLEVRLWGDATERWRAHFEDHEWGALDLAALVAALVRLLIDVHRGGARQRRILEARHGPGSGSEAAQAFERMLDADMRTLLLRHEAKIAHPDPPVAVALGIAAVRGVLRLRDADALHSPSLEELDDEEWAEALTALCLTWLTGGGGTGEGGEQVDFFEIWG